ncbi:MAG: AraC family transcriptional regulator [Chryseobacterium sp.]|jgi:AraC-like DNA-binding protein|nr:AraC family transcriptional regulator [Chryseobacterium sp.]
MNGQKNILTLKSYVQLRSKYENMSENNTDALPFVYNYLKKAKQEKNYKKIFQGYQDAAFFSNNKFQKLQYADSCVISVLPSADHELISSAYLEKGVIYYFFYKQYKPALNEYLKAYEYSKNIKNDFLKYRIIYHLGVVKSYLGYYEDALKLFNQCVIHFQPLTDGNIHPNLIFNNRKGYFNSVHQQIICYSNLRDFKKSDSLIRLSLNTIPLSTDFKLERAYFIKSSAISDFRKLRFNETIEKLKLALPEFKRYNDFTWTSFCYFYIGKSYQRLNKEKEAVEYFTKVDSIFQKQQFIIPELRSNYESLINYYNKTNNTQKELYYTKQLLNADKNLNSDFQYLTNKIYKEYDTQALLEKQRLLENKSIYGSVALACSIIMIVVLFLILYYRGRREKHIKYKYYILQERLKINQLPPDNENLDSDEIKIQKTGVSDNIARDILVKLNEFEKKKTFKKKGITLSDMAKNFGTNTKYLSQVINEYKGKKFNTYINELRINYITRELYHDIRLLDYTIEGLAEQCGISSRQNFSDFFNEINGIRPSEFIKKRRLELKDNNKQG